MNTFTIFTKALSVLKRKRVLFLMLMLGAMSSMGQVVTVTGCTGAGNGTYSTLSAAAAAIVAAQPSATILITVSGTTSEPTAGAVFVAGTWTSLRIEPTGGAAATITGAATAGSPLISFNGSDNVTIDGLNTGGNSLTISNTTASSTSGTSTIRFQTDATNNTITNCSILGSSNSATGTNGGNIFFASGATTTGNDGNTISNCNIGPAGTNLPSKCIYFSGTSNTDPGTANSGIIITNNNIFDYFAPAVSSAGIDLNSGTTNISITNNRFYQTATRTQTTGSSHKAINLNNSSGNNYTITGNTIGFANSSGTGTYNFVGVSSSSVFIPIFVNTATTTASNINSNTIAGISMSGAVSGTSSSASFRGIYVSAGLANCNSNTIGSLTTNGSINFTSSSTSASDVIGIYNFGSSNWTTNNNNIGGISASNSSTGAANIYGLRCNTTSTATWTCTGNTIGGNISNSINSTSTATATVVNGILNSNPIGTFTNNTIRNLTVAGGTGTGTNASMVGIAIAATSANHTVSQNIIHSLSNSNTSASVQVNGIVYNSSTGTNLVARNLIHSLNIVSSVATSSMSGINILAGTATYQNNMIRLGIDSAGGSLTNGIIINGINETTAGIDNMYFNSVYIGGSSVGGTANTFAFQSTITTNTRNFRNNIFYNARSNGAGTGKHYAVRVGGNVPNPGGLTIDYNIYLANGTGGVFGLFNALDVVNLAAWKSAVGQDANSWESNPQYLTPNGNASTIDLHINPSLATAVESKGVNISTVTDDYDGQTRSGLTPEDIGADALNATTLPTCTGTPAASTVTGAASVCTGSGTTLGLSNTYTDIGITYQWYSSTVSGGPYTTLGTSSTQATGILTTTTYYKCTIGCTFSGLSYSTVEKAVTVNPLPFVTIDPVSTSYCSPNGTPTHVDASGAATYSWSPSSGISATTGAGVNFTPAATTTYTVIGTDVNGCTASSTIVVSIVTFPQNVIATATPATICSGATSNLTSSAYVQNTTSLTSTYTLTGSAATYVPISGTVLGSGIIGDDVGIGNLPLGFTFNYNGSAETVFGVSSNGLIQLGNTSATFTGFSANALASTAKVIAPLWDDNNTTGATVEYTTTGSVGNRVCTIQWTNIHIGNGGSSTNPTMSMQVKLYETTGIIQFIYGSTSAAFVTTTASIGISGASGNFVSVTPLNPVNTSTTSTSTENTSISAATNFPSGTTYTFKAPSLPLTYSWLAAGNVVNAAAQNTATNALSATTTFTVTASNGTCAGTATTTVSIIPLSCTAATITGATCAGTNFTATANFSGGGAPYSYSWSDGSATVYPNTASVTVNLAAGTYTLTSTVSDACGASCTSSVVVTVNALPSVSVTPSSGLICIPGGSAITLTTSGAATYAWSPTTGLTPTTGSPVSANPSSSTTYTLSGTDANGCVSTSTAVITVAPAVPGISASASPNPICAGSTLSLSSAVTASAPSLYNFAGSSNPPYTSITGTTLGAGSIGDDVAIGNLPIGFTFNYNGTPQTVFAVASNGFIELGSTLSYSNNTGSGWTPSSNLLSGRANILAPLWEDNNTTGGSIIYATTGSVGSRVLTVQWTGMHVGSTGSASQPTIDMQVRLYEGSNKIEFMYGATNASFTSTTASIGISGNVGNFLSVTPLLPVNTSTKSSITENSTISSATNFPSGTMYTFTPTTFNFTWTGPNLYSSSTQYPLITNIPVANSGTYTVTATSSAGCTATSATSAVTVNPLPTATPSVSSTNPICVGGSATISVALTGSAPWSYDVYDGTNTVNHLATSSPDVFNVSPGSTTTYTVTTILDNNNCLANGTNATTVTVNPLPTATLSGAASICTGNSTNLNIAFTGTAPWTYSLNGAATVTTSNNPEIISINPTSNTTYTVTSLSDANCAGTASNTYTLTVNQLPTASISGTTTICNGDAAILTVNLTGAGPWNFTIYKIVAGNVVGLFNTSSSTNTYTVSFSPTSTASYQLGNLTDANCSGSVSGSADITVNQPTITSTSHVDCDTYTWPINSATYTNSGDYVYTYLNATNCVSSDTLHLTINHSTLDTIAITACDSYAWASPLGDGMTYTSGGIFTHTSLNANNCIHTQTLVLTINASTSGTTTTTECDTYTWAAPLGDGANYTVGGTYTHTSLNANNCVHTQTLMLTINASTSGTTTATACDTYIWGAPLGDGASHTSSGTYTHTTLNANNCVHTQTLVLTINASTGGTTTTTACDNYTWAAPLGDGATYTSGGTFTHTSLNANNCVHTQTLILTINASTSGTTTATACDNYTWAAPLGDGMTYTSGGTFTHTSLNANNCVHTQALVLTINASSSGTTTATACDSYIWAAPLGDGASYTTSGTYTNTTLNASNCVHTQTLVLTVNASTSGTTTATACDTYTWMTPLGSGTTYTTGGTYTNTTLDASNCVHTQTLVLTINASTNGTTSATACNSYTWAGPLGNGTTYTASGTYTNTTLNASNCVHTQTLILTINASTSGTTTTTACDSYTWAGPLGNGTTYTASGTYTNTLLNASNCVHTQTLVLTINTSTSGTTTASVCDSYIWAAPLGDGATYTLSGTYTHTSLNAANCVHTQTLVLTITPSSSHTSTVSVCDSYLWTVNGITYTSSGTYTSVSGCHTEILNLTITTSTSNTTTASVCDSYLWSLNGTTYTTSGVYSIVTGCHTEFLNVTITPSTTTNSTIVACGTYTWSANGVTYTTSGSYTYVNGCATYHLNLTINATTIFNQTVNALACYTWPVNGASYSITGMYTYTTNNVTTGCSETYNLNLTVTPGVKLNAKVLLAGPYDTATGLMYDTLRVRNLIPSAEPYTTSPYSKLFTANETASETVSGAVLGVSGNDAIVDWVYLELRNSTTPSTIMYTKRALVQRDGDIVSSIDGVSPVFFNNVPAGSYYVSVKHRNHLGVMSAAPIAFASCSNAVADFIGGAVYVSSGIATSPRKLISTGVNALWSADCNNNKNVKYNGLSNDKDVILNSVGVGTPNNTISNVYRMEDANMDGKIRYNNADNDRMLIINNLGVNSPNNILFQHTPN